MAFKYKVQTYFDIATRADTMQIVNFSCGGEALRKRCQHLFLAYKYFKLGKLSIKFVPASTLPVDPLGLSYDDDDPQTVDPRDQLDCGLVRITNGEDILDDLTNISDDAMRGMYEAMLLDPRWYKFGLQSGFKRTARPLYWQIGQFHQDMFPGVISNVPKNVTAGSVQDNGVVAGLTELPVSVEQHFNTAEAVSVGTDSVLIHPTASDPRGFFQVGHRGRLGFLPTESLQPIVHGGVNARVRADVPLVAPIPEIRVITAILPKMRKTNYYYRCYVTEEIFFSGVKHYGPSLGAGDTFYGEIDQFIRPVSLEASTPSVAIPHTVKPAENPPNDGGSEI